MPGWLRGAEELPLSQNEGMGWLPPDSLSSAALCVRSKQRGCLCQQLAWQGRYPGGLFGGVLKVPFEAGLLAARATSCSQEPLRRAQAENDLEPFRAILISLRQLEDAGESWYSDSGFAARPRAATSLSSLGYPKNQPEDPANVTPGPGPSLSHRAVSSCYCWAAASPASVARQLLPQAGCH